MFKNAYANLVEVLENNLSISTEVFVSDFRDFQTYPKKSIENRNKIYFCCPLAEYYC